jgi:hypothetical protein
MLAGRICSTDPIQTTKLHYFVQLKSLQYKHLLVSSNKNRYRLFIATNFCGVSVQAVYHFRRSGFSNIPMPLSLRLISTRLFGISISVPNIYFRSAVSIGGKVRKN